MEVALFKKIANAIRHLTIDTIEAAGSGHPGLPLGCAEIGAYLYGAFLRYDPKYPQWVGRDRMILSAGHGSCLLYSCLHLAGFAISIEDLQKFRRLGSKTPSHPERTKTEGIEATTGLDGQGIGFAVGQALALKIAKIDTKVVCLAGDGCLMEGVSYEASSFAGHLNLNNLILLYDSNKTTLDGYVQESFSEDVALRFKAQGWDVLEIDGHDFFAIENALLPLRTHQTKPILIITHTKIGYGCLSKQGTPQIHSKPLGEKDVKLTKEFLQLPDSLFFVDPTVYAFFQNKPSCGAPFVCVPKLEEEVLQKVAISSPIAGREASHLVLQALAEHLPTLIGGSADLSSSDGTYLDNYPLITSCDFTGRNIKYGVREFAMGSIAVGMAQTNLVVPFIGTFLAFTDYMKSALRMASLMRLKIIYQFTHDSIFIGADGPTHQPIEQLVSLRAIPGLLVIRPADANEVKMGWLAAFKYEGPTALILSKQPLKELKAIPYEEGVGRGAYIVRKERGKEVDYLLIATGSEVHLALEVAEELGDKTRVISMPSWELFEKQPPTYKKTLLQGKCKVSIEAGSSLGWHKYVGSEGIVISVEYFGESGQADEVAAHFGFTKEKILKKILEQNYKS